MATLKFTPRNAGRWFVWGAFALVLALLPLVFRQGFALTLMSQMGIMIVFALSYNMLLGQTGLLSFGHAVYMGLGAYCAIHALNLVGQGRLALPVSLLPLVGGLAAALAGAAIGWVTTRKAGVAFAMISLGIGEMVHAMSLMFPAFFGGEGGVNANRVVGPAPLGITFGPALQVYYLIALWTFLGTAAMFALTRTPLGRVANAVRDNEERAAFVGYDAARVRLLMFVLSAFFAGIAGGLAAINYEIVTAETVSTARSGAVLLAAYIGGIGFFFGPVIGAVIFTLFQSALSGVTNAWLLYLGLFFIAIVLFAPGGVAMIVMQNLRVWQFGLLGRLVRPYGGALAALLLALAGFVGLVEMTYHVSAAGAPPELALGGVALAPFTATPWLACAALLAAGGALGVRARRRVRAQWDGVQREIETRIAAAGRA
ncbi:MAG: branched-chain amino acid ABC transporter permease [Burkholderiales bacterium]